MKERKTTMRKDFRDAKNMQVLRDHERLQSIIDKMIVHIAYCDMEVMTAHKFKCTITDLVTVANNTEYCAACHTVLDYVERFIDENDSYVEIWDGAMDDLNFVYDLLSERKLFKQADVISQVRITITVK